MWLMRVLIGELLPCGCLVGVYQVNHERVVAMIDAVGSECAEHRLHAVVRVRRPGVCDEVGEPKQAEHS